MPHKTSIDTPAELLVFKAPGCPHCAKAIANAGRLADEHPTIRTRVVDVQEEVELATRFSVRSVPTTVLDQDLVWVGVVSIEDMKAAILSRGSDEYGARVLVSLIESGRMEDAVQHLLNDGVSHFAVAWKTSTTSSRMGLMLCAEEALAASPDSLDRIVDDLLPTLESENGALRGDTADLLGQIGHQAAIEALELLSTDPIPDVAEIAADAIESIQEHGRPAQVNRG